MEQPREGYLQLSQKVVKYAKGLPLALVTLGSFLVGRTIDEWQSALNSFKKTKGEIFDILKISYDGLEEMWKEIFLDIACFFTGRKKDKVIEILENCGFDARIGISVLVEKSLLTVDDDECLRMHDLLQEMGEKIVRLKSDGNLGKQSRLWLSEDLIYVLENNMATEAIQAIAVESRVEYFNREEIIESLKEYAKKSREEDFELEEFGESREVDFNLEELSEGFSKMSNLRLLFFDANLRLLKIDTWSDLNDQRHLALPNNLRYLRWKNCPFKCLASSHKRMAFVQLDLQHSNFEYLWEGVMRSVNLKFIDLSHSGNLIRTPDFSGVPMLVVLKLSSCYRLVEIHPSIGQLSRLRYLDLYNCNNLTDLPCMSAVMQSLTVLDLCRCFEFSSFPKFTGKMKSLSTLILAWTAIKKVEPSSIECLPALTFLDLSLCNNIECLPNNMDNLRSLETLSLYGCGKLKSLPRLPPTARVLGVGVCSLVGWAAAGIKLRNQLEPLSQWLP